MLGLVNVKNRVKQLKLNYVHKIYNEKCQSHMRENFKLISEKNMDTIVDLVTFYYSAIKDWNSLPVEIKSIKNKT